MEPLENLNIAQRGILQFGTEDEKRRLAESLNLSLSDVGLEEEQETEAPQTEEPELNIAQRGILQYGTEEEKARLISQLGITPESAERLTEEPVEGFTGQFLTGRNYRAVRDYMSTRFGMTEENYTREEIVDSFIDNMRGFNGGNSVRVTSELANLYKATEEEKTQYEQAYRLWDEVNGVFSSESNSTLGEKAEGVYDYIRTAIADPVNLFTFGAGKLVGAAAGRVAVEGGRRLAAREVAQMGIRQAVTEAGEAAAARATGTALERRLAVETARRDARARATAGMIEASTPEGALYQQALRRAYRGEVAGGAGFEAVSSGIVDIGYQDAMIEANVQEEFNPLQFALSTAIPAVIGGVALARATGSTDVNRVVNQNAIQTKIEESRVVRINAAINSGEAVRRKLSESEAGEKLSENIENAISGFSTWREKLKSGELVIRGADQEPIDRLDEDLAYFYFMNGSREIGAPGISDFVVDSFEMDTLLAIRDNSEKFTDALGNILEFLPRDKQLEVINFFNMTVGETVPSLKVNNTKDLVGYLSKKASSAGRVLSTSSVAENTIFGAGLITAKQLKQEGAQQPVGTSVVNILIKGSADEVPAEDVSKVVRESRIETLQNNYVRTLVTHPGTTMLNLNGWAQMSAINVMSNTLRGTLYGSVGLLEGLVKGDMKASTYAHKAAMEFGALKTQLSNLVNPYATYDQAMSYLLERESARKELFRFIAGGVESGYDEDLILRRAGLQNATPSDAGFFEKYMQAMQVVYGVRAVDFLSKTQEFMSALDRQIRRNYGQSFEEFMVRDDFAELMTSKNSATFKEFMKIEARAVDDATRATFNKSMKSDIGIGRIAGFIEDLRKWPVIGALAPFGQFFNNTMALTADLTGLSIPYHYYLKAASKRLGKEYIGRDRDELITKMAVGYGLMAIAVNKEMENMEEGLPWYAERQSNGSVVDRRYDFPYAAFKGYGRIVAHLFRDGSVPEDLMIEVSETVGFGSFSRQLTETYGSVVEGVMTALSDPSNEMAPAIWNSVEIAMAQYASGVTRSVDPLNQMIAISRGEDYEAIDRSVGNRNINNAIRYIDQFIEPFMDPDRQSPVSATTGREPTAQTNRIFGYRELPAPSTVERMFADIGRPNWKTEIYVPDANAGRILKEHVYPFLEYRAAEMLESQLWENSNLEQRQAAVRSLMTGARRDMMESLRNSYEEPDRKAAFIYDIFNANLNTRARDRLIESFGVTPETLWTLTEDQLDILLYMIKGQASSLRETSRVIREGNVR